MAQPASGKPSLIDHAPSGGPGSVGGESIRMLDELDAGTRPARRTAVRGGSGWMLAGVLLVMVCGVSWWWWQQRAQADDSAESATQVAAATPTSVSKSVPSAAPAASAAAEPVPAATIVAMPERAPAAAAPSSVLPAAAGAPAPAASRSAASADAARAVVAPPVTSKPKAAPPVRDTRLAAASNVDRKQTSAATSTVNRKPSAGPSGDPDVALLSAMLATMSRETNPTSTGAPNAQSQLTIAQLVQRCDMRGVKDAIETFECKRRICDGYWGKADACPMSLSPKRN